MLGRGALADPFLAARIRAHEAGEELGPVAQEWSRVWPLLIASWAMVQEDVLPRHAPGRLKQWVNLLRRHYPQAEALFQRLKVLREVAQIDELLRDFAAATQPSGLACRAA
jgi:tRNA-dihydrouridine synthase C